MMQAGTDATSRDGPDFVCVGAQKAGTQWLYDQLSWHPDFWMPPVKEFHYLDRGGFDRRRRAAVSLRRRARLGLPILNATRGRKGYRPLGPRDIAFLDRYIDLLAEDRVDLEGYASLFAEKGTSLAGDITPGYARIDESDIARFATRFPGTRIIYLARDPVERLWSHLMMVARQGGGVGDIKLDRVKKFAARPVVRLRCTNTEVVRRWREAVGSDRLGVFFFDDIRSEPEAARADILRFLGADPALRSGALPPGYNRKSDDRKTAMTDEIRRLLAEEFADELCESAKVFGGAAAAWPGKYGPDIGRS